ncbi:MAG: hypothetical protein IPI50_15210 [Saprospiraceae bacterium]|nr:hypothetical protein [Saprospiraceae bacterium]
MNYKTVYTVIPEKLNQFIMDCDLIENKDKGLYLAEWLWSKHLLTLVRGNTYFPLASKYKRLMVRDRNDYKYVTLLQNHAFIVDKYSKVRKRCNYSKMKNEFADSPLVEIEYKVRSIKRKNEKTSEICLKLKNLCEGLSIDFEGYAGVEGLVKSMKSSIEKKVEKYIEIKNNEVFYKGIKRGEINELEGVKSKYTDLTIKYHKSILYKLVNGNLAPPSRNATNARLDYILTSLPKEYLTQIRYNNEELVEMDMASSQPMFFSNLIRYKAIPMVDDNKVTDKDVYSLCTYIPILFSENEKLSIPEDLDRFMNQAFSGTLYDNVPGFNSRDEFKKALMRCFFDTPKAFETSQYYQALYEIYPSLIKLIKEIKTSLSRYYYTLKNVGTPKKRKVIFVVKKYHHIRLEAMNLQLYCKVLRQKFL